MRRWIRALVVGGAMVAASGTAPAAAQTDHEKLAREIYAELVEINTTDTERGDNTRAAEAMAARLLAAGFEARDVSVLVPAERKGNLVARYRSRNPRARPILLLAHLDVVEARREDWSVDPFTFLERDGFYYGRGTTDDKAMAAIWIANLVRMRKEGFEPDRDIIVALTADEEGGDYNGVMWLLEHHRDRIDAAFALNEGGGGQIRNGEKLLNAVQASEKVYQSFQLEVTNPGGHSSRPTEENAIYRLAGVLGKLAAHRFPVILNDVTREYFRRMAQLEGGQVATDMAQMAEPAPNASAVQRLSRQPYYNALLRTTCIATMLEGGHAENALPQLARATVNCRILQGESPAAVLQTLEQTMGDPQVRITPIADAKPSPPSPLIPDVMDPIERITAAMWGDVPVVPVMSTGATDGLYLRQAGIPVYGVSGLFSDIDDNRAHGRDERMSVQSFREGLEFLDRLVRSLVGPAT
jgi:acetylornithine deacetylase/succinyl-diaminopimelate desuccinylase-like protein